MRKIIAFILIFTLVIPVFSQTADTPIPDEEAPPAEVEAPAPEVEALAEEGEEPITPRDPFLNKDLSLEERLDYGMELVYTPEKITNEHVETISKLEKDAIQRGNKRLINQSRNIYVLFLDQKANYEVQTRSSEILSEKKAEKTGETLKGIGSGTIKTIRYSALGASAIGFLGTIIFDNIKKDNYKIYQDSSEPHEQINAYENYEAADILTGMSMTIFFSGCLTFLVTLFLDS